jgi:hypothetical protein
VHLASPSSRWALPPRTWERLRRTRTERFAGCAEPEERIQNGGQTETRYYPQPGFVLATRTVRRNRMM